MNTNTRTRWRDDLKEENIKKQEEKTVQKRNQDTLIDCRFNILIAIFLHTMEKMKSFVHIAPLFIGRLLWFKAKFMRIRGTMGQADGKRLKHWS